MALRLVIIGAGQFGRAAAAMINTAGYELLAYGDNNPGMWNASLPHPLGDTIPVYSVEDALKKKPDAVLIGVIDPERTRQLIVQLEDLGFSGKIIPLRDVSTLLDIRSGTLVRLAQRIRSLNISGSVAELGVYKGDLAWKLNILFPDRFLYLFDTFEGFDPRDIREEYKKDCSQAKKEEFQDTSLSLVKNRLPYPDQARFRSGYFPDTAAGLEQEVFAFVSLDADLYAPIRAGLDFFLPRMAKGGMILLHDYNNQRFRGAKQAVEEYESLHGPLSLVPLCDLHGSVVILA